MRSKLDFGATTYISNRFLLIQLASNTSHSFHRPSTRIEDTSIQVFERFTHVNPSAGVSYAESLQSFACVVRGETIRSTKI